MSSPIYWRGKALSSTEAYETPRATGTPSILDWISPLHSRSPLTQRRTCWTSCANSRCTSPGCWSCARPVERRTIPSPAAAAANALADRVDHFLTQPPIAPGNTEPSDEVTTGPEAAAC